MKPATCGKEKQDENAYLLGYSARLTAGEHTIQFKIDVDSPKPLHFRNIYLVKVADLPAA